MNIGHLSRPQTRGALLALGIALLSSRPAAADARLLSLATKDLIYDPGRQRIYASIPNDGSSRANTVTVIDPESGAIGPSLPVGSDPGKMALSGDGRYLYVGLDGANAVRRVDLQIWQPDLQFSVNIGQQPSYVVDDMQAVPGSPRSVAVLLGTPGLSPRFAGIIIYDDGVARPQTIAPYPSGILEASRIQFGASPAVLYALDEEISSVVVRLSVDASGVTTAGGASLPSGHASELRFSQGLLYLGSGAVVDPQTFRVTGSFGSVPQPSLVLPDPAVKRVYFLASTESPSGMVLKLLAYDQQTLLPVDSQEIPVSFEHVGSLIPWGTDGLAFRTDQDQVALLRTRLRTPNVVSADLAVTGGVSPNPVRVGDALTYQLWVQNYGPDTETGATLSSALPVGTAFVSMTSSQGRCVRYGRRLTCELGALPAGARALVTLVLRSVATGPLLHTVTV